MAGRVATVTALYNEIEPYAVEWLRNLIAEGHIARGTVDDRSICDLAPVDVAGAGQRHFFAGIGCWSYALRLAGWPDDRDVWTASLPCQPFSPAGRRRGAADHRHLWPVFFRFVEECRPSVLFGEQVASADGLAWFATVRADLEAAGYAVGAADLAAASVGAPHIRQRLLFVAVADADCGRQQREHQRDVSARQPDAGRRGADGARRPGLVGRSRSADGGRLGHADRESRPVQPHPGRPVESLAHADRPGAGGGLGDADMLAVRRDRRAVPGAQGSDGGAVRDSDHRPRPAGEDLAGAWDDAEWLLCRDGKIRPAQPGSFPLVDGAAEKLGLDSAGRRAWHRRRAGSLRGYGNTIVAPLVAEFIAAAQDVIDRRAA